MTDDHSASVAATLAPESGDDGGLSIEAVAAAQSISKDAVRRRLRLDGQIPESPLLRQSSATVAEEDRQSSTSVEGDEHHGGATVVPTSAQPADVAALVGIIDRLTVENGELRTEANGWKSEALLFAVQLTQARERLAITARADSPVAGQPEPQPVTRLALIPERGCLTTCGRRWLPCCSWSPCSP